MLFEVSHLPIRIVPLRVILQSIDYPPPHLIMILCFAPDENRQSSKHGVVVGGWGFLCFVSAVASVLELLAEITTNTQNNPQTDYCDIDPSADIASSE